MTPDEHLDTLSAERFSPLGPTPLAMLDTADSGAAIRARALTETTACIVLGIDADGTLPDLDPVTFDALLTTVRGAPAPWVSVPRERLQSTWAHIERTVAKAPIAASVALRTLRIAETLSFADALHCESTAYSTLLGGDSFRQWLSRRPPSPTPASVHEPVTVSRSGDILDIRLADPASRNAFGRAMRDALHETLAAALDDPSAPSVRLSGEGACFSVGGDLAEFGSSADLAQAHAIRVQRSCALLLHRLGDRATAYLHGACIGSGIEIPAAAARRVGAARTFFQLPELAMGLMPGAGGTVSLPRAIGRHRTATMLLTGMRVRAATALEWGLLHAIETP